MVLKIVHAVGDVIVGDMVGQQMNIVDEVVSLVRIFETSVGEDLQLLDGGVLVASDHLTGAQLFETLLTHEHQQHVEPVLRLRVAVESDLAGLQVDGTLRLLQRFDAELIDHRLDHLISHRLETFHPQFLLDCIGEFEVALPSHVSYQRFDHELVFRFCFGADLQRLAQVGLLHAVQHRDLVVLGLQLELLLVDVIVDQSEELSQEPEVLDASQHVICDLGF